MSTSLLRIIAADGPRLPERQAVDPETLSAASRMLADIRARGEPAVREYAERLGDLQSGVQMVIERSELRAAADRLSSADRGVLDRVAGRIETFARAQRGCIHDLDLPITGGQAGHRLIPVDAAGCYAPGGRFPLPSSVLMTAVTARAAGVGTVVVASPRPTDATLAAAHIAGADALLAIGGVQAIAALAFGLCGGPRCDMIVGPGNRWVTAAKLLVSDRVGIDMLAGPSELLVLADDSADPVLVAADLLAQAEHDDDAVPMLITTDASLLAKVEACLAGMLVDLSTSATARPALRNGFCVLARDLDEAIAVTNTVAAEHLQIMTRDAEQVATRIRHAGAVFVGPASAEVLGDYGAGPNHVLPTGGTSRFRAGLSVFTFLRARTYLCMDGSSDRDQIARDAAALARIESLDGHAKAAMLRVTAG